MLQIRCGQCDKLLEMPENAAGQMVACPYCKVKLLVPGLSPNGPKAPPVSAEQPDPPPRSDLPIVDPLSDLGQGNATAEPDHVSDSDPDPELDDLVPQEISFARPEENEDDDIDMTSMVDVTFLLLIFFMVTTTFAAQKSIELPAPDQKQEAAQARTITEIEQDDDYIIVRIASDDTIWVNDREASSKQDMMVKLRETRGEMSADGATPRCLLILADSQCMHKTVISAIDAGNAVGFDSIRRDTVDDDDF